MKRKLFICAMAAALLLTACGTKPNNPTTGTTTPSLATLPAQPTQPTNTTNPARAIDSTYTASDDRAFFSGSFLLQQLQVSARNGEAFSVSIKRTDPDKTKTTIQVQYDPEKKVFTYQTDEESRAFSHLIATRYADGFDASFYELFLLSNKPDATYADTLGANPSAVLVFANFVELEDLVESYGTSPALFLHETIGPLELEQGVYLEKSFFLIDSKEDDLWFPSAKASPTLYRYDYLGNLLCTTEIPSAATSAKFCELSDGGFLMIYSDNGPILARCSSDGTVLWTYRLPFSRSYSQFPCVMGNAIYCFGVIEDSLDSFVSLGRDIAVVKLSMDGAMLAEKQFTDSIPFGVEVQGNSIRIRGRSYNTEGDFPYPGYFQATMDSELNITSVETLGDTKAVAEILGYQGGNAVWSDSIFFNYQAGDKLPLSINPSQLSENVTNLHFFSTELGYVVVRKYMPDADTRTPSGALGAQFGYSQLIFTGYSLSGTPQWQRATPIYLSRRPTEDTIIIRPA